VNTKNLHRGKKGKGRNTSKKSGGGESQAELKGVQRNSPKRGRSYARENQWGFRRSRGSREEVPDDEATDPPSVWRKKKQRREKVK